MAVIVQAFKAESPISTYEAFQANRAMLLDVIAGAVKKELISMGKDAQKLKFFRPVVVDMKALRKAA